MVLPQDPSTENRVYPQILEPWRQRVVGRDQRRQVPREVLIAGRKHIVEAPLPEVFGLCEHAAEAASPFAGLCDQLRIHVAHGHDEIHRLDLTRLQDQFPRRLALGIGLSAEHLQLVRRGGEPGRIRIWGGRKWVLRVRGWPT